MCLLKRCSNIKLLMGSADVGLNARKCSKPASLWPWQPFHQIRTCKLCTCNLAEICQITVHSGMSHQHQLLSPSSLPSARYWKPSARNCLHNHYMLCSTGLANTTHSEGCMTWSRWPQAHRMHDLERRTDQPRLSSGS